MIREVKLGKQCFGTRVFSVRATYSGFSAVPFVHCSFLHWTVICYFFLKFYYFQLQCTLCAIFNYSVYLVRFSTTVYIVCYFQLVYIVCAEKAEGRRT